jgi:hypothetical protein
MNNSTSVSTVCVCAHCRFECVIKIAVFWRGPGQFLHNRPRACPNTHACTCAHVCVCAHACACTRVTALACACVRALCACVRAHADVRAHAHARAHKPARENQWPNQSRILIFVLVQRGIFGFCERWAISKRSCDKNCRIWLV